MSDTLWLKGLIIKIAEVKDQTKGLLEVGVKERTSVLDFVTLKAYEFPFINVLWIGVLVMVVGIVMSIVQKIQANSEGLLRQRFNYFGREGVISFNIIVLLSAFLNLFLPILFPPV